VNQVRADNKDIIFFSALHFAGFSKQFLNKTFKNLLFSRETVKINESFGNLMF
jgi:hypothetical protein